MGYNGGSAGSTGASGNRGVGGGGATDFCLDSDSYFHCSSINVHYPYRILVAGGGGGAALRDCTDGTRYGGVADWYDSRSIYGHGHTNSNNNDIYSYFDNSKLYYYAPFGGQGTTNNGLVSNPDAYYGVAMEYDGTHEDARPLGGGGGGYYGGHVNNYTSEAKVGGGAGSSFRFEGKHISSLDKQDSRFALTSDTTGYSSIEAHATCVPSTNTHILTCEPIEGTYVIDTRRAGSPKVTYPCFS